MRKKEKERKEETTIIMNGWYGFRAQGIHNGEREKGVGITVPPKEMMGEVRYSLYSRGQGGGISGTAGTSGMRTVPPGL